MPPMIATPPISTVSGEGEPGYSNQYNAAMTGIEMQIMAPAAIVLARYMPF